MIKYCCFSLTILLSLCAFCQKDIKLEEIKDHVGDSVKICGKIFTARYFANAQDAPTLLNMGDAYPNQKITIVIYGNTRKEFGSNS